MDHYAGLDVSLGETAICVVDAAGRIVKEARAPSESEALITALRDIGLPLARVGMEACSLTAWLHDGLQSAGLPAICIETRQANAAMKTMPNKTDRNDARALAQIMRTGWFRQVHVKSRQCRLWRSLLVARRTVLNEMRAVENVVRAILREDGIKLGTPARAAFAGRVRELAGGDPVVMRLVEPLLAILATMLDQLACLTKQVLDIARDEQICRRLMTVNYETPPNTTFRYNTRGSVWSLLYCMFPQLWNNLTHIVTHIAQKLHILTEGKRMGRPLALNPIEAIVWGLYWHQSTRVTKQSVYDDFKKAIPCTYKTFVESINRVAHLVLLILFYFMRMGRKDQHLVKYTDATDIPVCLAKNGKHHKTMDGLAAWGHSGKGFYFGLKMTMTRDKDGRLLALCFTPANTDDRAIFRKINEYIEGIIVADAGYVSKALERDMNNDHRWVLIKPYKNMKKLAEAWQLHLYKKRFDIEFDFRDLKLFHGLVTSLPRSVNGYLANYLYALLSFVLKPART